MAVPGRKPLKWCGQNGTQCNSDHLLWTRRTSGISLASTLKGLMMTGHGAAARVKATRMPDAASILNENHGHRMTELPRASRGNGSHPQRHLPLPRSSIPSSQTNQMTQITTANGMANGFTIAQHKGSSRTTAVRLSGSASESASTRRTCHRPHEYQRQHQDHRMPTRSATKERTKLRSLCVHSMRKDHHRHGNNSASNLQPLERRRHQPSGGCKHSESDSAGRDGRYCGRLYPDARKRDGNGTMVYRGSIDHLLDDTYNMYEAYTGDWKQGMFHGVGGLVYSFGDQDESGFENNKKHGIGQHRFRNGRVSHGMYRHNAMKKGSLWHANGTRYLGLFVRGKQNGFGTFYFDKNSSTDHEGQWENDKSNGRRDLQWSDASYHNGDRAQGEMHGMERTSTTTELFS